MTPERARQIGNRWRWAALAVMALGVLAALITDAAWPFLAVILAFMFSQEASECYGWRSGWLAREREELKRPDRRWGRSGMTSPYKREINTMDAIMAETAALIPTIAEAKRGTPHEACDGWSLRDGEALCRCGVPLDEIFGDQR